MPQKYHYIFDMDKTLYPPENPLADNLMHFVFGLISERTGLSMEEVDAEILKRIYQKVDPYTSMAKDFGYDLADIMIYPRHLDYGVLQPCVETRKLISDLPAQSKVIYTDSIAEHAELVLTRLHLRDLFDKVYDIAFSGYKGKAIIDNFSHVLEDMQANPADCVMVEDSYLNLKIAKEMGMRTVLIRAKDDAPEWVDEHHPDLPSWLRKEVEQG